jgi:hypothetical protein
MPHYTAGTKELWRFSIMFCRACGKEVHAECVICPGCGVATGVASPSTLSSVQGDAGGIGWWFLGFFFPLIGLILYLVWKQTQPKNSSMVGRGALVGFIANVLILILYSIIVWLLLEV